MEIKRFILYLLRWQLSVVLAPILSVMTGTVAVLPTITANLIGGAVFYYVDRKIFEAKK